MNGMKPKFLEGEYLTEEYFQEPNPYKVVVSCKVNLLELSRYAKRNNKALTELTKEEVMRFAVQDA